MHVDGSVLPDVSPDLTSNYSAAQVGLSRCLDETGLWNFNVIVE
jgi:hypothetical protein